MKKFRFLSIILVLLIVGGGGGFFWWKNAVGAPSGDKTPRRFLILKGETAEEIGKKLVEVDLIKSSLAFKIYLRYRDLEKSIPPGEFRIAGNLSLKEVTEVLIKGPIQVWITLPEGLRREQIGERFIEGLELTPVAAENFRREFLVASAGKEGFLFPDTYLFPRDVSATKVVEKMIVTFETKFGEETGNSGLTLEELVILASIIERETLSEEERPIVAGIYLKRLRAGWSLDADATVQYAVANLKCIEQRTYNIDCNWWPRQLTVEDLEIKSAYNTYRNVGLPNGPICNPGRASLLAVSNYQDSPYWFYIHDSAGKIHYAKTLEEHNMNVTKYLK